MKVYVKVTETPRAFKEIAINANDFMFGNVYYSYNEHNPERYYKYIRTTEKTSPLDNTNSVEETYVYTFDKICSEEESDFIHELNAMCSAIATLKLHGNTNKFEMMMNKIDEIIEDTFADEFGTDVTGDDTKTFKKDIDEYKIKEYAIHKVKEEFRQGFQAMEYDLNTIGSSRGDYPFVKESDLERINKALRNVPDGFEKYKSSFANDDSDKESAPKNDTSAKKNDNPFAEFIIGSFNFNVRLSSKESCGNQENKSFAFSARVTNMMNGEVTESCICRKDTTADSDIYHSEIDGAIYMLANRVNPIGMTYLSPNTYHIDSEALAMKFIVNCAFIKAVGVYNFSNNFDKYMPIVNEINQILDRTMIE